MTSEHLPRASGADELVRPVTLKGRYRIVGPGVPGDGVVTYGAETAATQQSVALAVLRGETAADAEFVTAVREQAYRLAKPACEHASLVRVHDTGTTDEGEPFVALERVVGRSLREVLQERGAFSAREGVRLAIQVGEGLETLHRSGIVHGELRPESIVLVKDDNGGAVVKLVGVELTAARRTPAGLRTRDETLRGYLAPEQVTHAETTEAADVHALGLLVLEMLTGQRPSEDGRRSLTEMPPAIARIVATAVEPGPGRRYSSISLMVNDLWSADTEPAKSAARPASAAVAPRRSTSGRHARSDVGMATALVVGLLLVGVTAWVVSYERLARRAPSESTESAVAASPVAPAQPSVAAPAMPIAPEPATVTGAAPVSLPAPSTEPAVQPTPPPVEETRVEVGKPATVGAVRAPRAAARRPERPVRTEEPSADGGDGTAIIDWLLKDGRSGG